ncbi:hypothetical protein OG393_34010 (plasmid) [Streptomyces sp. NBC_01216]|uniref:hypothetical protein n=1 Tax=Streptomyces sp. NBC_01216 TaxID=2903778 RepID=UPI002E0F99F3|nr:hypothetical protein OG393_34010 [Streptomyces sp. NBC_01216]
MRMLLPATRPGHRGGCVRARQGCTCFYFTFARGRAKVAERRIARRVESRRWRRDEAALDT